MSRRDFGTIQSLVHFDFPYYREPGDGLADEVGIAEWTPTNADDVILAGAEIPYAKYFAPVFGYRCCYFQNGAGIRSSNDSGIFNLDSSKSYEIECFVYRESEEEAYEVTEQATNEETGEVSEQVVTKTRLVAISDGPIFTWGGENGFVVATTHLTCKSWGLNESFDGLSFNNWNHLLIRISNSVLSLFINGELIKRVSLRSSSLFPTEVILGGFTGYMDEFCFRTALRPNTMPIVPVKSYNGKLNLNLVGGTGTGANGDLVVTKNYTFNYTCYVNKVISNSEVEVYGQIAGIETGTELMVWVKSGNPDHIGKYTFRIVRKIEVKTTEEGTFSYITFNKPVVLDPTTDFILTSVADLETYTIALVTVPNYLSVTINAEAVVTQGLVIFRCKNDCAIHGKILTHGLGTDRNDLYQLTNARFIDRFIPSRGGGIFIVCGGDLFIGSNARLGAPWNGYTTAKHAHGTCGHGGSAGYKQSGAIGGVGGGAGGGISGTPCGGDASPGNGGGGCGGRGGDGSSSSAGTWPTGGGGGGQGIGFGAAGSNPYTFSRSPQNTSAGYNYCYATAGSDGTIHGGISGIATSGSRTEWYYHNSAADYTDFSTSTFKDTHPVGGGGGGPGGNGATGYSYAYDYSSKSYSYNYTIGSTSTYFKKSTTYTDRTYLGTPYVFRGGFAGASILLVCRVLNIQNKAAISTGGESGLNGYYNGYVNGVAQVHSYYANNSWNTFNTNCASMYYSQLARKCYYYNSKGKKTYTTVYSTGYPQYSGLIYKPHSYAAGGGTGFCYIACKEMVE